MCVYVSVYVCMYVCMSVTSSRKYAPPENFFPGFQEKAITNVTALVFYDNCENILKPRPLVAEKITIFQTY